jgi:energy-coupling factor transporter transmembrane protein EcfT
MFTLAALHLQEPRHGRKKIFVEWRPLSRRNPIHTLKPTAKAIMHTFFSHLVISEPTPLTLMIMGAISLGSLTIFLHHKLG